MDVDPGVVGQAIEMDAQNGMQSRPGQNYGLRDSDGDVQGMVGLQQQRQHQQGGDDVAGPTSDYAEE